MKRNLRKQFEEERESKLVCENIEGGDIPKLVQTDGGLALVGDGLEVKADFTKMIPRIKQSNMEHEMLVKAARLKNYEGVPHIIDATAGLGEDSFLLAAAGFRVTLIEYDHIIASLLRDGLERALEVPEICEIARRMTFIEGDSTKIIPEQKDVSVVYLDPMFPGRQKSGLIKKKFQLLQQLERPCGNEKELLEAALAVKPKKIVIKRPAKGPYLCDIKPDYSYEGKAIRYDCLVNIDSILIP